MRFCLLTSLLVLAGAAAFAAPPGPLSAGTAPGVVPNPSPEFRIGVHYPIDVDIFYTMPPLAPPQMPNYTAPYDEWPDPAAVRGRRAAMTSDIVIFSSKNRKK